MTDEREQLPAAIDAPDCSCTSCVMGATVSLDNALEAHVAAMLNGEIKNCTGVELDVEVCYVMNSDGQYLGGPRVRVTYEYPDPYRSAGIGGELTWQLESGAVDVSKVGR